MLGGLRHLEEGIQMNNMKNRTRRKIHKIHCHNNNNNNNKKKNNNNNNNNNNNE